MPDFLYEYLTFYRKYAVDKWNHITPREYLVLLILVGVIGFMWMLRGSKKLSG